MSEKRSKIGNWMPRAVSSSMSSFISIWPGVAAGEGINGMAAPLTAGNCCVEGNASDVGVTIKLPCSLTEK